jgi:signal transduction histidine kinase
VGIAPNVDSSGRAPAPEPPVRGVDKRLKGYLAFASRLAARARERSFAAMRHSLAVRLLIAVLLFGTCVTLILTLLQIYLEYRHDVSALESQLDQISRTNLDSLSERLWALDENQLRLQLTGILRLPDMRAVEVREAGSARDRLIIRLGEKSASSAITREYALLYNVRGQKTRIGTLHVEATLAGIYSSLFHRGFSIFVGQAATIFLTSLFVLYIFHYLVTRHLFTISSFVDSYRIEAPPSPLRLRRAPRDDELERVVRAFNGLSESLQTSYRNLQEANERLARDEQALRRSEFYLAESEKLVHTGSWACDPFTDTVLYWSEEMFRVFELYPEDGLPTVDVINQRIHPDDREKTHKTVRTSFKHNVDFGVDYRILLPDDRVKHIRMLGHPAISRTGETTQYLGTVIDVTERKRAEEERDRLRHLEAELAHVGRVSTLGELAAAISHELKQPLTATITNADAALRWLKRDQPDVEEACKPITRIIKDGTRANEIIDRLRSLYKKSPPKRELVDVNEIVREMLVLLRGEANRYSISMQTELAADPPKVIADRVQLQQVLMNLMLNGIEAMKETGGQLTIKLRSIDDGQLLIAVSDTGVGLPADKADEIFDTFFTTKPQGSGMGLTISRSIVESHGGRLWATSNSGLGATFHFTVPTADEAHQVPAAGT